MNTGACKWETSIRSQQRPIYQCSRDNFTSAVLKLFVARLPLKNMRRSIAIKKNLIWILVKKMSPQPHQTLVYFCTFKKKIILIHGGLTPCFPPGHNHLWICAPQFENHLCCSSILCGQKSCSCGSEMRSAFCAPWKPSLKWTSYAFTYFLSYTNTKHMKHGHTFK